MTSTRRQRIVAVTQRVDCVPVTGETRDALDQMLTRWLAASGFLAVPVPNALVTSDHDEPAAALLGWLQHVRPEAIVLSGGNDIGDRPERDRTERELLAWAAGRRVPVLGICRGLQMMAVWSGGTLVRVANHVAVRHALAPAPGSDGWPPEVNSFHQWGLSACPPGFVVTARVHDGGIEAIRHEQLPWEGWMWHPERERPFSPQDVCRMESLFVA